MRSIVSFDSPYYPYEKTEAGYNTMKGAEKIPIKLLMYLLDMADAHGYTPVDDNERPRVRLAKYLWYDGANPLNNPLPTDKEKLSMLYDGEHPVVNTDEEKALHPKGFRLFPVMYWQQSATQAIPLLKCFIGNVIPKTPYREIIEIFFQIVVHDSIETTTKSDAYSRSYAIEQCLVESLHGLNITGIGTISFNRQEYSTAGSTLYADEGHNIYRNVVFTLDWMEGNGIPIADY